MRAPQPRFIAYLLCGLLLAACATAKATGDSGVEGMVWVGPTCPVVQEGVDCPDSPLEADLEVQNASGRVVARGRSDAQGAYRIPLAPGNYMLVPLSPGEVGLPFASPLPLVITAGNWEKLDIYYDSGIR
ncbi:MAG TPA: carboxypeptidase-like regulatory domain-containing protein [Anaerolineales bacterium]|nr:carboxypeptidase-like regulatory domain-containing protein [Anaerolineales bacterium]